MTGKQTKAVGTMLKGVSEVTRPDGTVNRVSDGFYVLDVEGTFVVDGDEVTVK